MCVCVRVCACVCVCVFVCVCMCVCSGGSRVSQMGAHDVGKMFCRKLHQNERNWTELLLPAFIKRFLAPHVMNSSDSLLATSMAGEYLTHLLFYALEGLFQVEQGFTLSVTFRDSRYQFPLHPTGRALTSD